MLLDIFQSIHFFFLNGFLLMQGSMFGYIYIFYSQYQILVTVVKKFKGFIFLDLLQIRLFEVGSLFWTKMSLRTFRGRAKIFIPKQISWDNVKVETFQGLLDSFVNLIKRKLIIAYNLFQRQVPFTYLNLVYNCFYPINLIFSGYNFWGQNYLIFFKTI